MGALLWVWVVVSECNRISSQLDECCRYFGTYYRGCFFNTLYSANLACQPAHAFSVELEDTKTLWTPSSRQHHTLLFHSGFPQMSRVPYQEPAKPAGHVRLQCHSVTCWENQWYVPMRRKILFPWILSFSFKKDIGTMKSLKMLTSN